MSLFPVGILVVGRGIWVNLYDPGLAGKIDIPSGYTPVFNQENVYLTLWINYKICMINFMRPTTLLKSTIVWSNISLNY